MEIALFQNLQNRKLTARKEIGRNNARAHNKELRGGSSRNLALGFSCFRHGGFVENFKMSI